MAFPSGSQSGGAFSLGDTRGWSSHVHFSYTKIILGLLLALKLSADTKVEATTTVEAHLIPSINFGIEALDVATANVALSLDASATMVLKVEAKAVRVFCLLIAESIDMPSGCKCNHPAGEFQEAGRFVWGRRRFDRRVGGDVRHGSPKLTP